MFCLSRDHYIGLERHLLENDCVAGRHQFEWCDGEIVFSGAGDSEGVLEDVPLPRDDADVEIINNDRIFAEGLKK